MTMDIILGAYKVGHSFSVAHTYIGRARTWIPPFRSGVGVSMEEPNNDGLGYYRRAANLEGRTYTSRSAFGGDSACHKVQVYPTAFFVSVGRVIWLRIFPGVCQGRAN